MKTYQSFSSKDTEKLGAEIARQLKVGLKKKGSIQNKQAVVLALKGDLGAGKTTFVQGFLKGLGLKKRSPSPTFIIMRRHPLKGVGGFKNLFHVDTYRLKDVHALAALDFEDVLANPENIVLIEWADRAKDILPKSARWLMFRHGRKENERSIIIKR